MTDREIRLALLANEMSEPDMVREVKARTKWEQEGLLTFLYRSQGELLGEGILNVNPHWRVQFERLGKQVRILETQLKKGSTEVMPSELDTDLARGYLNKAVEAGWLTPTYKPIIDNKMFYASFVVDMNAILWQRYPGKEGARLKYKPFEDLFGLDYKLTDVYKDVQRAGKCAEYERRRKEVFL